MTEATETTQTEEQTTQEQESSPVAAAAISITKASTIDAFVTGLHEWGVPIYATGPIKVASVAVHYATEMGVDDSNRGAIA